MLEDMSNNIVASEVPTVESDPINEERQTDQQIPREFRRSGRIIRQPDMFISSGVALEAKAIGHEDDPYTYNETMADVDATLWKKGYERWDRINGFQQGLGTCRLAQRDKTHRMQVGL